MIVTFNDGNSISLLFWLLFGHVLADYPLQSDFIAVGKNRHNSPHNGVPWYYIMFAHCLLHGGMVVMFTGNIWLGLGEVVLHFVIDVLKCEKVTNIHQDQSLHVACKVGYLVF